MIEPKGFSFNHETTDNFFQMQATLQAPGETAMREFQDLKKKLLSADINVNVFSPKEGTPDAVFPNNWFSTTPSGKLILYPMMAPNRRKERSKEIIDKLKKNYPELIDLSALENTEVFLEGTGSLVIDHEKKIAFAALSQRTNKEALKEWSKKVGYEIYSFTATDKNKATVYHTNVVLTLCDGFAIFCDEAITDVDERTKIMEKLSEDREVIHISLDQMHSFCGNCLELRNDSGRKFLVMSAQAYNAFTEKQKSTFIKYATIIYSSLNTIETIGGGSARCMIAELF